MSKAWTDREHALYRDVKESVANEAVAKERLRVVKAENTVLKRCKDVFAKSPQ